MAKMVKNAKNNWQLTDTSEKITYTKTFKTAGQFVDRDIEIAVSAKEGNVVIPESTITLTPSIVYKEDLDKYEVIASENVAVTPQVTEGWVSEATSSIVYIEGKLNLDSTKMTSGLVEDTTQTSGFSVYRTSASKGYNDKALNSDIKVFQGEYN